MGGGRTACVHLDFISLWLAPGERWKICQGVGWEWDGHGNGCADVEAVRICCGIRCIVAVSGEGRVEEPAVDVDDKEGGMSSGIRVRVR